MGNARRDWTRCCLVPSLSASLRSLANWANCPRLEGVCQQKSDEKNNEKSNNESTINILSQWKTNAGCGAAASPPVNNNSNGSVAISGFNQLRNEFLTAARRVATTRKQAIGEVVEWASGGAFKYGDIGRMTEADTPKLRAATELIASTVASTAR